ncbi:MAG: signal peptidase I [Lachnospiraceae bacterium]|nr:signal peptidase I [Lachnospiraceae bacterium]
MRRRSNKGLTFYTKERKIDRKLLGEISSWVFSAVLMAGIAFVFVYLFGIRTSVIGVSMEPTLQNGQEILIDRFVYLLSQPKRGDVVVFLPNGNGNSHYYVKRIVGTPGDTVLIRDGLIYINGDIYDDAGLFDRIEDGGIAAGGIHLDEEEYFVLGDNRNDSEDSRSSNIGIVRKDFIIGRAWFHMKSTRERAGFIE